VGKGEARPKSEARASRGPKALTRRRVLAAGVACVAAAGAFALGVSVGDGSGPALNPAAQLSLQQLAGERIVAGFSGTHVPASMEQMIRDGRIAGVVLFADNLPSRAAGRRLVASLQRIPRPPGLRDPLLVMVDQEGGLVKRLSGAPSASAKEMGARGADFSREQGQRTAANLHNVGVNVDLAPVLDVARPGGTIAEAERGFGSTVGRVEETAIPFAEAMQEGGVAAAAKHFPGLGAAHLNTDVAVQRIGLSKQMLRRVDEAPYRRFSAVGGDLVMLSTAIYPALSPKPAAFARPVAVGELRARLGFQGVSITDALDTVSVRAFGGPAKAGLAAARAGADLLLFTDPRPAVRAQQTLFRFLRNGVSDRSAFDESADRVLRLRSRLPAN
jgi:beta-N-acetylhexosaminidase